MTAAPLATPATPAAPGVAPRWLVLAALGGTLGTLAALFPGQALLSDAQRQPGTDAVSLSYLKLLVQSSPDNARLRLTLVRALAQLAHYDEARATLEPLLAHPGAEGEEARRRALELSLQATAALPAGDAVRPRLAERAAVDAARLAHDSLDPGDAQRLRSLAEAAGLPALQAQLAQAAQALDAPPAPPRADLPAQAAAAPARAFVPTAQRHAPAVLGRRAAPPAAADPTPDDDAQIALHNASGDHAQAIALALQAHARTGDPRWLLLAMDAAARGQDWAALARVSALAHRQPAGIEDTPMFWQLEAHLARHTGELERAREAYRRGLVLRPAAMDLRTQAIWLELDHGDVAHLQPLLEAGAAQAETEPAAWTAYASGALRTGQPEAAWHWFDRLMARDDADPLWAAGFLDTLEQAGHARKADAGRARLLPRLDTAWARAARDTGRAPDLALGKAYAGVLARVRGADAEAAVLQELVWRGAADAPVYERLVATRLARQDFAGAGAWVRLAQRDRQRLPGYQRLAVALHEGDRRGIEALLDEPAASLGTADRVTALRQLGRDAQALQLAQAALQDPADPSRSLLLRQVEELQRAFARHAGAAFESRSLSGLRLERAEISGDTPAGDARLSLRAAHVEIHAGGGPGFNALRPLDEDQAWVEARLPWGTRALTLGIGRNDREGSGLTQALAQLVQEAPGGARLQLTAAANESPYETSLLRAIGTRDRVSLYGALPLAQDLHLGVEASLHRFRTRAGESLAHGGRLVAELSKTLPQDARWQLRVSGSTEHNRLTAAVPASVAASVSPAPAAVESIVAPRFSTLGAGVDWRSDRAVDPAAPRSPALVLDAWAGRQWPAAKAAYSARAALELPVAPHDVFAVEASYSNVQRDAQARASHAVGVRLQHEF